MTRDEAVTLVSRALAIIQLVSAGLEGTYFPAYLLSWKHHAGFGSNLDFGADYFTRLCSLELGALILRFSGLLFAAYIFWNVGPRIARILLPSATPGEPTAS